MTTFEEKIHLDADDATPPPGMTRRAVLKLGGVTGLAMTTGGTALAAGVHRPSHLRRSSYTSLIGQRFSVGQGGSLQLVAIKDLNSRQRGSENAFELVFSRAHGASRLATAMPNLKHSRLGSFPLFVTPGKKTKSGQHYCAVINRAHG